MPENTGEWRSRGGGFLAVLWLCLGLGGLAIPVFNRPPAFSSLTPVSETLTSYVRVTHGRGSGSVRVPVTGRNMWVNNYCHVWKCHLPEDLALLGEGDRLQVWAEGNTIWQLAYGNEIILPYADAVAAATDSARQLRVVFFPFTLTGAAMLVLVTIGSLRKRGMPGG